MVLSPVVSLVFVMVMAHLGLIGKSLAVDANSMFRFGAELDLAAGLEERVFEGG
jgi:hypothetical protein